MFFLAARAGSVLGPPGVDGLEAEEIVNSESAKAGEDTPPYLAGLGGLLPELHPQIPPIAERRPSQGALLQTEGY
jgi:hypothetical protein